MASRARPITITDNGKIINTKRRISGSTLNHNHKGFNGFLKYKGVEIRAYSDDGQTWRANAQDTLIKTY